MMGIPQFTKDLLDTLDKKSISSDFRKKPVHPKSAIPKKKGIIDQATELNAKDSPEIKAQFDEEYTKRCTPFAREKEIQADLNRVALDLADSPHLEIDDDNIVDNPEIKKAIRKLNKQVCGTCLSVNCILKQMISKKLKMLKLQTNFGCRGSPKIKFAAIRPKEVRTAHTETAPPAENPQPSGASEIVSGFFEELDEEEGNPAGATPAVSLAAGFKIKRPQITKDSIPTKADLRRGGAARDKSCVICLKPNLSMYALNIHVTSAHRIDIGDPLHRWIQAAQAWDKFLEENPDYDSDYEESTACDAEPNKKVATPKRRNRAARTGSNPNSSNKDELKKKE